MAKRRTSDEISKAKDDIISTLSIAALSGADNATIQQIAYSLIDRAPGAMKKSFLLPLAQSEEALDIVLEEMCFPQSEKWIGTARINDYEYDITLKWTDTLTYVQSEVVELIAAQFLQRGFTSGRLYLRFTHPQYRFEDSTSVDMQTFCDQTQMGLKVA